MEDIKLNYIGNVDPLPKNIKIILIGEKHVFVKWQFGKFTVLPDEKQEELRKKYVNSESKNI
jgi:hypothetical protein